MNNYLMVNIKINFKSFSSVRKKQLCMYVVFPSNTCRFTIIFHEIRLWYLGKLWMLCSYWKSYKWISSRSRMYLVWPAKISVQSPHMILKSKIAPKETSFTSWFWNFVCVCWQMVQRCICSFPNRSKI